MSGDDALARAVAERHLEVGELVARAEAEAREEVLATLRRLFADELLRRVRQELEPGSVVALAGIAEGLRPLVLELDRSALDDETQLERLVRRHNDLLLEALADGVVLPFRFGTTFADRAALDDWLERHRGPLSLELDRLDGRAEWSVEVVAPPRPEGGRYLEERLATAVLPDVRARLADVSEERSGDAYLVAKEQQDAFAAALAELEAAGHELRVTGPWPPYSFARLPA
ncbi:MAG TPA: GvpL/GvpF family gas vesicle protein [Gaiellaceae bacterium]|nr:GvpL/GvpF family gas vesicle protein [Gaiellaceae bacterium]